MLTYPQIDPVILQIGPLKIHWYGMMYLMGFMVGWWLGVWRAKQPNALLKPEQVGDLIFYIAIGVVVGGRLGYVLFYDLPAYIASPLAIFEVWRGGMSFHGGLLGVTLAIWFYAFTLARQNARSITTNFFQLGDFIAPLVPPGLFFGRIGNFINGELWGRPTDVPWGMVFPHADNLVRHPSQLYQAFFEGIVLFTILWLFSSKPRPTMAVSGLFLILYGIFRFFTEFFRTPDKQLGFIAFDWLTMGQLLCIPMLLLGIFLMLLAYRRRSPTSLINP